VSVTLPDLTTSTTRTPVMVSFGPDTEAIHALVVEEPARVRLLTYPEGALVPTAPFDDVLMGSGVTLAPLSPLEDRWYAIRIEIGGPVLGTSFVDGVQMARFRTGSQPIFQEAVAADRLGRRILDVRFSERVENGTSCRTWPLTDDEGAMPCRCIGPEPGETQYRAVFVCERHERGAIHLELGPVPHNVHGIPLQDLEGHPISSLTMAPTGRVYPGGGVQLR
jgi:hypothetical protein